MHETCKIFEDHNFNAYLALRHGQEKNKNNTIFIGIIILKHTAYDKSLILGSTKYIWNNMFFSFICIDSSKSSSVWIALFF